MNATVSDPLLFAMNRALCRVAATYRLPRDRVQRGCAAIREGLRQTDPDYQAVMDAAIREMMRD